MTPGDVRQTPPRQMPAGNGPGERHEGMRQEDPRRETFAHAVAEKEERKLRARGKRQTLLFGMGMFGLVGWSLAVPVVVCLWVGIELDRRTQSGISWTVTLLFSGVVIGAINAWYWVERERRGEP